jgi:NADPH:quinone reductase-like Zn-dependent oxidoreductase
MRKIVIHRPGGFDKLKIENFPDPQINKDEVLVKTNAIGVNYADCVIRMGYYASAKEYVGWPITPGFDFSGTVIATGENIKDVPVGTGVFGISRFDAYSTHVAVPRHQIWMIPEKVAFEEAGAFPTVFLTAYYALHMIVHIFPNSKILIHSAAGGVGSALLQLCKNAGWYSIGVVGSSEKVKTAKEFGADVVIDKSRENLWDMVEHFAPEGADVVLDGNGVLTLKESFKHLRPTGKLIAYGFHSMFPKNRGVPNLFKLAYDYFRTPRFNLIGMHERNRAIATFNLSFLFERTDLLEGAMKVLYKLFSDGKIGVPKVTTYPFEEVARAHQDLQSGKTIGKLVLIP